MDNLKTILDTLIQRGEEYGKTAYDLIKLTLIEKSAEVLSALFSHLILLFAVFIFLIVLSLGASIALGYYLENLPLGFLIISGFYLIVCIVLAILHPVIKRSINDALIARQLKSLK